MRRPIKDIYEAGYTNLLEKKDFIDGKRKGISRYDLVNYQSFNLTDNRSLRIFKSGSLTIASGSYDALLNQSSATGAVTHDLGYKPVFLAFYRVGTGTSFLPIPNFQFFFGPGGYSSFNSSNSRCDEKKVYFDFFADQNVLTYPIEVKYYIFREKING